MAYIGYPYSTEQALNIRFEGDFVRVPTGSTADRTNNISAPEAGMFRFNTDESKFEGYNGNDWVSIGGINTVDFTDCQCKIRKTFWFKILMLIKEIIKFIFLFMF